MNTGRTLHVVVPDGVEDPTRPSGGNTYDRRLCDHLAADGWSVTVRAVDGEWPRAGEEARRALAQVFESITSGTPDATRPSTSTSESSAMDANTRASARRAPSPARGHSPGTARTDTDQPPAVRSAQSRRS